MHEVAIRSTYTTSSFFTLERHQERGRNLHNSLLEFLASKPTSSHSRTIHGASFVCARFTRRKLEKYSTCNIAQRWFLNNQTDIHNCLSIRSIKGGESFLLVEEKERGDLFAWKKVCTQICRCRGCRIEKNDLGF